MISYNSLTLKHFDQPQHVGCFAQINQDIGCARIEALGQSIQLHIQFDSEKQVKAARFKANAEPYIIAALSIICEQIRGKAIDQCRNFDFEQLANRLEIPTAQKYCIILVEDVVNAAIDDAL